jgi:hypothetical protein
MNHRLVLFDNREASDKREALLDCPLISALTVELCRFSETESTFSFVEHFFRFRCT